MVGIPFELTKWLETHEKQLDKINHIISTWCKYDMLSTLESEVAETEVFLNKFKDMLKETDTPNRAIKLLEKKLV